MTVFRNRLSLLLVAGAMLPAVLSAQSSTGSLSGRVTNADGTASKAGVSITVVQKGTNLTRKTSSDAEGNWRSPALPVGDYKVIMEFGGQAHTFSRGVNLGTDSVLRFKWPAEMGAVVTVETMASGVDAINTTSAEVGMNVDKESIANLPILDRNINSLAVLAPGVQIIQGSQVDPTKKAQTYIVSGDGQGRGTNFNVDGADNNSSDVGGIVMPVPFDAVDQFQVVTNQYKAEFGRSNAGFLNMVTKSGTNEFAGIANVQYTNQDFRARRTDEGTKLANSQSIYALTLSGPIIKDKLFYMVSGEMTKSNTGQYFAPEAIATYPILGNMPTALDKHNLYTKLDWNINQNWLASLTYARYYDKSVNQTFSNSSTVADFVSPGMLGTNKDDVTKYGIKVTATIGTTVWESTANYFNYVNKIVPTSAGGNATGGIDFFVQGADTASSAPWAVGQDWLAEQNTGVKRYQWKNELTESLPEHTIKVGADVQWTSYPNELWFFPTIQAQTFYLNPGSVPFNQALSNTVTGADISAISIVAPLGNPGTSFHGYGFYAQDDWTVTPKLNIYLGGRVDWDTQLQAYNGLDPIYAYIHAANPALPGISNEAPAPRKYWSPRIQIVYKPRQDDSLTFKAGFGQFVASTIDNVVGFSRGLYGNTNGVAIGFQPNNAAGTYFNGGSTIGTINGNPITLPVGVALTPYNYINNVGGIQNLLTNYVNQLTPASPTSGGRQLLASNFAYPTTQTFSFGFTTKLSDESSLEMTALLSNTKNQTCQGSPTDGSTPLSWSPTPAFAGTQWTSSGGNGAQYDQADSIFYSDQKTVSKQVQVKYVYNLPNFQFLMTFVAKDVQSTAGGDGGSFASSGAPDFFGGGAPYAWQPGPMRNATGTEPFSGSFSLGYRFESGLKMSALGQWHSGKYYDIFTSYPGYGPAGLGGQAATRANPALPIGLGVGSSCMDIGLRISQQFKIGKKATVEPFIQIQNLLNNYDYGTNYYNGAFLPVNGLVTNTPDPNLGQRIPGFQVNSPRTAAFGCRVNF